MTSKCNISCTFDWRLKFLSYILFYFQICVVLPTSNFLSKSQVFHIPFFNGHLFVVHFVHVPKYASYFFPWPPICCTFCTSSKFLSYLFLSPTICCTFCSSHHNFFLKSNFYLMSHLGFRTYWLHYGHHVIGLQFQSVILNQHVYKSKQQWNQYFKTRHIWKRPTCTRTLTIVTSYLYIDVTRVLMTLPSATWNHIVVFCTGETAFGQKL